MLLLIRPAAFACNTQTTINNFFQQQSDYLSQEDSHNEALREFDNLVETLRSADIETVVVQDTVEHSTPDSIFPNNWVSFHAEGHVLYPMFAPNRRLERQLNIWKMLKPTCPLIDLTHQENSGRFLEGTGSLVLDRLHRIAYASLSERTHPDLVRHWCEIMSYTPVIFNAMQTIQGERLPIYHTNVMMSIGENFALWCPTSIDTIDERNFVENSLKQGNRDIIEITEMQMWGYAGNILQVHNRKKQPHIILSTTAENILSGIALDSLARHGKILSAPIPTIERLGGGSVRCMVAEVY
jgi:hypothetical protein